MSKPSIPKGTRDFGPVQMARRNFIFATIRDTFTKYGFAPIETPAMEGLTTLTGKYGEEGDQLIFKILNNGDFLSKADQTALEEKNSKKLAFSISKKALRYDLTVPFARFVVMNQNDISFPFKRYQIQPVWRGDRPGKGRYQEFFQCDADVIGTTSLICEVELIQIFDEALTNLGVPDFTIKLNNRKILAGLAELGGAGEHMGQITIAIDKLDKIGLEKVMEELVNRGVPQVAIDVVAEFLTKQNDDSTNNEKLDWLAEKFEGVEVGQKGVKELREVIDLVDELGLRSAKLSLDLTLARGLDYYTGAIFEVAANGVSIGSICGGGRYDDLTGIFGLPNVSGVGISFGADRIYDVLEELDLFPQSAASVPQALFINFGEKEARYCLKTIKSLRGKGLACELYPSSAKMNKQMKYANDRGYPFVIMVGSREMESGVLLVKDMTTGDQANIDVIELFQYLVGG